MLVTSDYILARRFSAEQEKIVSEPAAIEIRRQHDEDEPQRKKAIQDGYSALIFPDAIESHERLLRIAKELKVAPLAPHPNSPLYYCNEGYGLITYKSDRLGFRNPDGMWDESNIKYVLIGDSFTQGACVPDDKNIAGVMAKHATVLNLGVGGDNPIHYAATAKLFIPRIKSEIVVMIFYANDNDAGNQDSIYYQYYLNDKPADYFDDTKTGKIVLSKSVLEFYDKSEPVVKDITNNAGRQISDLGFLDRGNILARAGTYLALPNIRRALGFASSSLMFDAGTLPFSSKLAIDTLVNECKKVGCLPVVSYIPNSEFWRPDPRSNSYASRLSEYANRSRAIFVDNRMLMQAMGARAYAIKGAHLSPEGYKAVTDNILKSAHR